MVGLLETIVELTFEDEQISAEENRAVARSKEWFKENPGTQLEDLAAELGLDMERIRDHKRPA